MTNKHFLSLILVMLFAIPLTSFAGTIERYCFQESNGSFYDLRGGKLGKKAYLVKVNNVYCPNEPLPGIATFTKLSNGYLLSIVITRDVGGSCQSYSVLATVDNALLNVTGLWDALPRNDFDGTFSMTRVACPATLQVNKGAL